MEKVSITEDLFDDSGVVFCESNMSNSHFLVKYFTWTAVRLPPFIQQVLLRMYGQKR